MSAMTNGCYLICDKAETLFFFKMKTEITTRDEPSNNENDISKIIRIRRKEARSYIYGIIGIQD